MGRGGLRTINCRSAIQLGEEDRAVRRSEVEVDFPTLLCEVTVRFDRLGREEMRIEKGEGEGSRRLLRWRVAMLGDAGEERSEERRGFA